MTYRIEQNKCPVCSKSVYFAEEVRAMGRAFHKICFKCYNCSKMLDSMSVNDHKGSLFCKSCYSKHIGPQGYGGGVNQTTLGRSYIDSEMTKSNGNLCSSYYYTNQPNCIESDNHNHHISSSNWDLSSRSNPRKQKRLKPLSIAQTMIIDHCANCESRVYANERVDAIGKVFHKFCFKCGECGRVLQRSTACDHDRQVFCQSCYVKNFGPKGMKAGTNMKCA